MTIRYFDQEPKSLTEAFYDRAVTRPNSCYIHFQEWSYSYHDMYAGASAWAEVFKEKGLRPGDRVCILFNNSHEFFLAFWGVLIAGGTVAPLAPASSRERVVRVVADCEAQLVVYEHEIASHFMEEAKSSQAPFYLDAAEVDQHSCPFEHIEPPVSRSGADIAFLQYTSGTTGYPKGVMLSHGAVLANLRGLMERMGTVPDQDVFSIMIPLYHDMGLIGFGLGAVYAGCKLVLFRQDIRNIYRWLDSFKQHKVTISGCSNTILHLTVRAVIDPSKYDLTSTRMMIVGSEPVSYRTVERFETVYRLPSIVTPAYGLAEISLCATMTAPNSGVKVDEKGFVSCGLPLSNIQLKIDADPDQVGEILVKTPSAMSGYYGRQELSGRAFDGEFMKTGDLGRVDESGNLYVCGRKKNVIIRDGKNLPPHELEEVATQVKGVRLASVFSMSSPHSSIGEEIYLVVEVSANALKKTEHLQQLYREIFRAATSSCRYQPDKVLFTKTTAIPHSLNGKMQHQKLKEQIEQGRFPFPLHVYPQP